MDSYWTRFTNTRINRRRALQTASAAGIGLAGIGLIGCGGGDGSSGGSGVAGDASGLLSKKVDVSAQGKQGAPGSPTGMKT
jgi:hypothetical protein